MTLGPRVVYHYRVDFLDEISGITKVYVMFAVLLGAGLLLYDCSTSDPAANRSTPQSRSVQDR